MPNNFLKTLLLCLATLYGCSRSPYSSGIVSPKSGSPVKEKVPGFIGLYHNSTGTVYGGWGLNNGELIQTAFDFGINGIISQAEYYGYTFQDNLIENCTVWNTNKIYGILRPPTEGGVVDQPGDTLLLQPFAQSPGMIQAAHRFSELSEEYPQISGVIIDDFYENFLKNDITINDLQDIKDALLGKAIDSKGNVDHSSEATTPNLKLYIVVYEDQLNIVNHSVADSVDGVNLWMHSQNENYKSLQSYLSTINQIYPGKHIIVGVYIKNSREEMTPESVHYMLQTSIDLYNQGSITGVFIFSAPWLTQQYISAGRWDSLAIPPLLDSLYYPYLGEASGRVMDSKAGVPISGAVVTVRRASGGNQLLVTRKSTGSSGEYDFGAWSGNGSPIVYEIEADKTPYKPGSIDVELQPGENIVLPDIQLKQ